MSEVKKYIDSVVARHADIIMDDCYNKDVTPRCDCIERLEALLNKAREDEMERTIAFFTDEGRESKEVLRAFKKNRKQELKSKQEGVRR